MRDNEQLLRVVLADAIWRTIPEFPEYQVSDRGEVRRVGAARGAKPGRLLRSKPRPERGYRTVRLWSRNREHPRYVHRLVLEAFVGQPEPGQEARHLNGDGSDNRLENLAWGSSSENKLDILRHGRNRGANQKSCRNGHEYTAENTMRESGGARRCRACKRARLERDNELRRQKRSARALDAAGLLRGGGRGE